MCSVDDHCCCNCTDGCSAVLPIKVRWVSQGRATALVKGQGPGGGGGAWHN
jgi:hypothetical protein